MEFFFPSDVFALEQPRASRSAAPFGSSCGFDAAPLFASSMVNAIQQQEAAQTRAQAIKRAKAARRVQQEREARAYLEHLYQLQRRDEILRQRQAQEQYQLQLQLQRQRQQQAAAREEQRRRQQYAEYQRRKAHAIEQERRRISAIRQAEDDSHQLWLALEDLLFGGFGYPQHLDRQQSAAGPSRSASPSQQRNAPTPNPQQQPAVDVKGKAKALDQGQEIQDEDMEPALDSLFGSGPASAPVPAPESAETRPTDDDPEEVGPAPTSAASESAQAPSVPTAAVAPASSEQHSDTKEKHDVLVFSHAFPADPQVASQVQADSIRISVDEQSNKVTVSGLWNNDGAPQQTSAPASPATQPYTIRPLSPTPSNESRKGRSRSPKRARVSDVDENGDEIVQPDQDHDEEADDGFVKLDHSDDEHLPSPAPSTATVTSATATTLAAPAAALDRSFELPAGATAENLRAELTDEGLKLWVSSA